MERVPHLLLVNSVLDDRVQLRRLLEPLNLHITEVASGLEAIETLQRATVDLVVTAIAIGEFDSWRLARFIRSGICRGGRTLPIIIVTRIWCERITEITARDFGINHLLAFEDRQRLPVLVQSCLKSPTEGLGQRRVLVVEDHEDNARLVKKILQTRFDVELAGDGKSGLKAWQEGRHDLVLLDIMLPGMSGTTVLDRIMKINPGQPVVIMTAHGTMDVAKNLMVSGAVDFVTKPFRADELRTVCDLATRREDYIVSNAQVADRMDRLQQLRNLLGNIIDSMPSVLVGVDQSGYVTLWNQGAEQLSGITAAAAQGRPLDEVWPDFSEMDEVRLSLAEGDIRKRSTVPYQHGGKNCYCDITIYPLFESDVVGAVIRLDDVTERVLMEERIVQSEKMVSIGQLAAGMAHEVNNPLAGVLQNIQVVRNRLSEHLEANRAAAEAADLDMTSLSHYLQSRDVNALLDTVMESGKRVVQLIENMLSFSRREDSSRIESDLVGLIERSVELAASNFSLQRKFDFRFVEIQREYDKGLPLINCNPVQIQQVILNLLMNGAHAMEEKLQKLRATTSGVVDYQPRFVLRTRYANQTATIEIEDNGTGMNEETQRQVFEPFFTTKKVGEGTGLGLSICYFIITKNHRGAMRVDSVPNVRTKFSLDLPTSAPCG